MHTLCRRPVSPRLKREIAAFEDNPLSFFHGGWERKGDPPFRLGPQFRLWAGQEGFEPPNTRIWSPVLYQFELLACIMIGGIPIQQKIEKVCQKIPSPGHRQPTAIDDVFGGTVGRQGSIVLIKKETGARGSARGLVTGRDRLDI